MVRNISIPSARPGKKSKDKKQEKVATTLSKEDADGASGSQPPEDGSKKRKCIELGDNEGGSVIYVGPDVNVFSDPSSVDIVVDQLGSERERMSLGGMKLSDALDEAAYAAYKATIAVAHVRREVKSEQSKIRSLQKDKDNLSKEKADLSEENQTLNERVVALEKELEGERANTKELEGELGSIVGKVVAKTRGEVMLEFKLKGSSEWNVEGEIENYKAQLPTDYEISLKEIMEELQDDDPLVDDGRTDVDPNPNDKGPEDPVV